MCGRRSFNAIFCYYYYYMLLSPYFLLQCTINDQNICSVLVKHRMLVTVKVWMMVKMGMTKLSISDIPKKSKRKKLFLETSLTQTQEIIKNKKNYLHTLPGESMSGYEKLRSILSEKISQNENFLD